MCAHTLAVGCLPVCLLVCLSACLLACLSACLLVCLPACLLVCLSACLVACLSACLLVCLSACLLACLSVRLYVCLLLVCLSACCLPVACVSGCLLVCLSACLFLPACQTDEGGREVALLAPTAICVTIPNPNPSTFVQHCASLGICIFQFIMSLPLPCLICLPPSTRFIISIRPSAAALRSLQDACWSSLASAAFPPALHCTVQPV